MSTSVGTATGCVRGQRPPTAYAMCRLWSALSRSRPFQQPAKVARRCSGRFDGQFGITADVGGAPNCPSNRPLHLRATFAGCWNGRDLDSADHKRHMAYAVGGRCPRTHPVAVPTLVLIFLSPETEQRRLLQASGRFGAHADFMNG